MSRRERSEMSIIDCQKAVVDLAKRVQRMGESSHVGMFGTTADPNEQAPPDCLTLMLQTKGRFGDNERFFEAIRVLRGWKLPRKDGA